MAKPTDLVGNQFHRHPGDQWWAVQEGEVTFTIKGQQPRLMKAGEFVYLPSGTVHRNQNLLKLPPRAINALFCPPVRL